MDYPNNIKKSSNTQPNYSNRGMDLETLLNDANDFYAESNRALIFKKPTPIGVVDVAYRNQRKIIEKAYFKAPSTLDYNGLYRGKYVEFEAKETKSTTSFPLANIHVHQVRHIRRVLLHGGIVFLIIKMNGLVYLLDGQDFLDYIDTEKRKSVPYSYILEKGTFMKEKINPPIDYLNVVDEKYFGGNL